MHRDTWKGNTNKCKIRRKEKESKLQVKKKGNISILIRFVSKLSKNDSKAIISKYTPGTIAWDNTADSEVCPSFSIISHENITWAYLFTNLMGKFSQLRLIIKKSYLHWTMFKKRQIWKTHYVISIILLSSRVINSNKKKQNSRFFFSQFSNQQ